MPNNSKSIRALVSAVIAAAYGLHGGPVQAVQKFDPLIDQPLDQTRADVWAKIDRINADNPTAYLKVKVAQEAGRSELVAAIVQAAAGAKSVDEVSAAIEAAVLRVGGLNSKNVIPLADLLKALRALGLSEAVITATINAYSIEVADAVAAGTLSSTVAAAILVEGATQNLYG